MKAKKKPARTRGRKRSTGAREPNGRLSRSFAPQGPTILDETLAQRARSLGVEAQGPMQDPSVPLVVVGLALRKAMQDEWAGYPLGRLRLRRMITDRQMQAGTSYALLRRRWDRLADAPGRHARVARLPIADVIPADLAPQVIDMLTLERESDVDGAWLRAKLHLRGIHRLVQGDALAVLEAVCVNEAAPHVAGWLPLLRLALDVVAGHFRLEPDDEAVH